MLVSFLEDCWNWPVAIGQASHSFSHRGVQVERDERANFRWSGRAERPKAMDHAQPLPFATYSIQSDSPRGDHREMRMSTFTPLVIFDHQINWFPFWATDKISPPANRRSSAEQVCRPITHKPCSSRGFTVVRTAQGAEKGIRPNK